MFSILLPGNIHTYSFSSLVQSLFPKDTLLRTYFTIFALVLTKALPKRCFLNFCHYSNQSLTKNCVRLYLFPYSNQSPSKKCVLSILLYSYESSTKKGVSLYICRYSNQSPTTKSVLLYFLPYSNQSPTKKVFSIFFSLILTKALPNMVIFLLLALILTKALNKWRFLALIYLKPCQKVCFTLFFFCRYSNQSPAIKNVYSMFGRILTKAQPKSVFLYF